MDSFVTGLAFYCFQMQNEVNRIRRFSQSIDSHWELKAKHLDIELDQSLAKTTCEDRRQELGEIFGIVYYEDILKSEWIHKHSIIITISSFVENSLYELCNLLSFHRDQPRIKLIKGNQSKVEQCLNYLKHNAGLSLADCKEEADTMIDIYKLRNHIIHNNGKVTEKFETQKAPWKGLIKGSLGAYIEIDSKFVTWYLEQVTSFYHKLAPEVQSFVQRTKLA